jgi:hypothetical protein
MKTKKDSFIPSLLKSLTSLTPFDWTFLLARGSAGGIFIGANSDLFKLIVGDLLNFSMSVSILDKKTGFSWKLVVVYGSMYDEGKQSFLDELHLVMSKWDGPTLIARDFNLVRFSSDKSSCLINHKWTNALNEWVSKWALVERDLDNKRFTWTTNQDNNLCKFPPCH